MCCAVPFHQVRYVLKNLARDWSAECAAEREQSYGRILTELRRLFKDWWVGAVGVGVGVV